MASTGIVHTTASRARSTARAVARVGTDSARLWRAQIVVLSMISVTTFFIVGAGLAARGEDFAGSPQTYHYLVNLMPAHSLRVHGFIMCVIAALTLLGLPDWSRFTRMMITIMGWYAICSALLLLEPWVFGKIGIVDWALPWLYLAAGAICVVLVRRGPEPVDVAEPEER